jgi:hypothetical protein
MLFWCTSSFSVPVAEAAVVTRLRPALLFPVAAVGVAVVA